MMIRRATPADADGMSRVLQAIIASTGRVRPSEADFVLGHYIDAVDGICCSVATDDDGVILGFQSLKRATPGNRFDVPQGWGIIGTHIDPTAHRRGVGKALFAASLDAAAAADIAQIDASIAADNPTGLAYYDAMGFTTWREPQGIVQKCYRLR